MKKGGAGPNQIKSEPGQFNITIDRLKRKGFTTDPYPLIYLNHLVCGLKPLSQ